MNEQIDCSKIDDLCIPSIKFLNDEMHLETRNSCQGLSREDKVGYNPKTSHSLFPYILFHFSVFKTLPKERLKAGEKSARRSALGLSCSAKWTFRRLSPSRL